MARARSSCSVTRIALTAEARFWWRSVRVAHFQFEKRAATRYMPKSLADRAAFRQTPPAMTPARAKPRAATAAAPTLALALILALCGCRNNEQEQARQFLERWQLIYN